MSTWQLDRRYRSDDRDLHNCDHELVVHMGDNGDWYVMIVNTGEKLGPAVRITTSGAPRALRLVAPAITNLYRALNGDKPFQLIDPDETADPLPPTYPSHEREHSRTHEVAKGEWVEGETIDDIRRELMIPPNQSAIEVIKSLVERAAHLENVVSNMRYTISTAGETPPNLPYS